MSLFWLLNFSDGENSLRDISKKSGISELELEKNAKLLVKSKLLKEIE
jgi:aminopeptidase-like protein